MSVWGLLFSKQCTYYNRHAKDIRGSCSSESGTHNTLLNCFKSLLDCEQYYECSVCKPTIQKHIIENFNMKFALHLFESVLKILYNRYYDILCSNSFISFDLLIICDCNGTFSELETMEINNVFMERY